MPLLITFLNSLQTFGIILGGPRTDCKLAFQTKHPESLARLLHDSQDEIKLFE